jgi:hypothetical protein
MQLPDTLRTLDFFVSRASNLYTCMVQEERRSATDAKLHDTLSTLNIRVGSTKGLNCTAALC